MQLSTMKIHSDAAETLSSWIKGLHKLFGESCNFIDDVRDSSSENSSVSMWVRL